MAIPWLIGAAVVAAAASAFSGDKASGSSSEDKEADKRNAKANATPDRHETEKEQVLIQKIAKLEQSVGHLMSSYALSETEALRFLNPDEDVEYLPDDLIQKHDDVKHDIDMVKKALRYIEDVENEL